MPKLRVFSGAELCNFLSEHGFERVRQRSSHHNAPSFFSSSAASPTRSSNGRAFHRDLDMLTPSLPLSRSLDLPVCVARFPSARLWLKDESLEDSANLPDPDVIVQEIVEYLEAALSQFAAIATDPKK
jgi:hypothetical protein